MQYIFLVRLSLSWKLNTFYRLFICVWPWREEILAEYKDSVPQPKIVTNLLWGTGTSCKEKNFKLGSWSPKKRGKRKGEGSSKNRDQKSYLSVPSHQLIKFEEEKRFGLQK